MATIRTPRGYDSDYLRCRSVRHSWDEYDGGGYPPCSFGLSLFWRCLRCGTVRLDVISRFTGERIARSRYFRPPGYSLPKDEVPSADELRVMEVHRRARDKRERKQQQRPIKAVV